MKIVHHEPFYHERAEYWCLDTMVHGAPNGETWTLRNVITGPNDEKIDAIRGEHVRFINRKLRKHE